MTDSAGDRAWTGTPVRPHPGARDNGAERLPWGGRRERLPLRWPFADAVAGYRSKALANPQYDPTSTFVWGQMMAVALIEVLTALAAAFAGAGGRQCRPNDARSSQRPGQALAGLPRRLRPVRRGRRGAPPAS